MAYLGNNPSQQAFAPAVDYFNGNASTVAFTLSRPVASVAQVQVTIENVPQNPSSAFTVSGSTITFTSAPPSGTSNIYVTYTSPITTVIAPGQGTVNTTQLGSITTIPNGAATLTLPTTTDTLVGKATTDTLTNKSIAATQLTGTIAAARLPAGSVLQVVNVTTTLSSSTTSASYVDTGLSLSITPSFTTSKILAMVTQVIQTDSTAAAAGFQLLRNATVASEWVSSSLGYGFNATSYNTFTGVNYLDSPATISAITYKTQFKRTNGSGTVYLNLNSPYHSLTLMEIAG